jgi:hypothetical protein
VVADSISPLAGRDSPALRQAASFLPSICQSTNTLLRVSRKVKATRRPICHGDGTVEHPEMYPVPVEVVDLVWADWLLIETHRQSGDTPNFWRPWVHE